jgi:hypothetical protein
MKTSLVSQFEKRVAELDRRCRPSCKLSDHRESPAAWRKGWLVTVCGQCGAFIGYRPAGGKSGPELTTEVTEDTERMEVEA